MILYMVFQGKNKAGPRQATEEEPWLDKGEEREAKKTGKVSTSICLGVSNFFSGHF